MNEGRRRTLDIPKDTNYTKHHPLWSNNPHKTVSSSTNRMSDHHTAPQNASLSPFSRPHPLFFSLLRLHPAIAMMIDWGAAFLSRYHVHSKISADIVFVSSPSSFKWVRLRPSAFVTGYNGKYVRLDRSIDEHNTKRSEKERDSWEGMLPRSGQQLTIIAYKLIRGVLMLDSQPDLAKRETGKASFLPQ